MFYNSNILDTDNQLWDSELKCGVKNRHGIKYDGFTAVSLQFTLIGLETCGQRITLWTRVNFNSTRTDVLVPALVTRIKYQPDPILYQLGFNFDSAARPLHVDRQLSLVLLTLCHVGHLFFFALLRNNHRLHPGGHSSNNQHILFLHFNLA